MKNILLCKGFIECMGYKMLYWNRYRNKKVRPSRTDLKKWSGMIINIIVEFEDVIKIQVWNCFCAIKRKVRCYHRNVGSTRFKILASIKYKRSSFSSTSLFTAWPWLTWLNNWYICPTETIANMTCKLLLIPKPFHNY